ncbi:hypothetical protein OAC57_07695 [Planktomarina temperata]|nr:hypothetical protein [Planktomarina temperata]
MTKITVKRQAKNHYFVCIFWTLVRGFLQKWGKLCGLVWISVQILSVGGYTLQKMGNLHQSLMVGCVFSQTVVIQNRRDLWRLTAELPEANGAGAIGFFAERLR